jgi:toxin ParE1/3/4
MSAVVYAPKAEDDLVSIADFIARDKPEAARRWVQRIRETCATLATQPEMGELRPDFGVIGCRSFGVGHYDVFFRQVESGIEVARVVHGSRDMRKL